jgi:hypothetical protein
LPLFVSRPEYIPEIKARMDLLLSDLTNQQRNQLGTGQVKQKQRGGELRTCQNQTVLLPNVSMGGK